MKFFAILPVRCCVIWHSECGWDSVRAHVQLGRVYLISTFDVTHVTKCTKLFPSLVGRALVSWPAGKTWLYLAGHETRGRSYVYAICCDCCVSILIGYGLITLS